MEECSGEGVCKAPQCWGTACLDRVHGGNWTSASPQAALLVWTRGSRRTVHRVSPGSHPVRCIKNAGNPSHHRREMWAALQRPTHSSLLQLCQS